MHYFKLERISLTLLVVFILGFIALIVFPLLISSTPLAGDLIAKIGMTIMVIISFL